MSDKNMEVARRLLDEVWTQGKLELLTEIVAEEAVAHPMPQFGAVNGPEEYKHFIAVYKSAFFTMTFTIEDQFASGNKVATRWISAVTELSGDARHDESGEPLTVDGVTITHHDSNGKIIAEWATWDTHSLLHSAAAPQIFQQLSIKV